MSSLPLEQGKIDPSNCNLLIVKGTQVEFLLLPSFFSCHKKDYHNYRAKVVQLKLCEQESEICVSYGKSHFSNKREQYDLRGHQIRLQNKTRDSLCLAKISLESF